MAKFKPGDRVVVLSNKERTVGGWEGEWAGLTGEVVEKKYSGGRVRVKPDHPVPGWNLKVKHFDKDDLELEMPCSEEIDEWDQSEDELCSCQAIE